MVLEEEIFWSSKLSYFAGHTSDTHRNGIDVILELDGVGENFQDHTAISVGLNYTEFA